MFFLDPPGRQTWIDTCQRIGADPREVVERRLDRIVQLILKGAAEDSKVNSSFCVFL